MRQGIKFSVTIQFALIAVIWSAGLSGLKADELLDGFDPDKGRKLYTQQCVQCHGSRGQGSEEHYDQTLTGDLSIEELAEIISDTMPEEDPDMCVAEDADAVAAYIHRAFYSPEAQRKLNRPRVELAHLTVEQHRRSIAGLIDSFGHAAWMPEDRGLAADYFASSYRKEKRRLAKETVDTIDFADGVPHFRADRIYEGVEEEKRENEIGSGFSAYWHGSLIAPTTGTYEFIVHSTNGFRLFVNSEEQPLIDRWVRSDDELTHRNSIFLLAGRAYRLKLQMFTFKDPTAAIELQWKPPHGEPALIPGRLLTKHHMPEVAAMSTPFPPDDGSRGYLRGSSVSQGWNEATTNIAIEAADWIADRVWKLAKTKKNAPDRITEVKKFCEQFVERAFVSPLSDDEKKFFIEQHFSDDTPAEDSVRRVVLLALKSPRFLYPAFQQRSAGLEKARRLALFFKDSVPDKALFKAGQKSQLVGEQLNAQAWRLLYTPAAKQKLRNFFHFWLKTEEALHASKDPELFPEYGKALTLDLQVSLDLFLDEIVWGEKPDFRQLFLSDKLYVNQRIADYYDLPFSGTEDSEEFQTIESESEPRSGILTHPLLMSGFAYHRDTSPIHRGVFIARNLLGRSLKQPAEAIPPLKEEFAPSMTTRQRVEHQTKAVACMACHKVINPLGFSLEQFDAVGRFRQKERDKLVDATSVYETSDGEAIELSGARDLGNYLAADETAQKSFIRRLFHHFNNQSIYAYGDEKLDELHESFVESGYNVQQLLIAMSSIVANHELPPSTETIATRAQP